MPSARIIRAMQITNGVYRQVGNIQLVQSVSSNGAFNTASVIRQINNVAKGNLLIAIGTGGHLGSLAGVVDDRGLVWTKIFTNTADSSEIIGVFVATATGAGTYNITGNLNGTSVGPILVVMEVAGAAGTLQFVNALGDVSGASPRTQTAHSSGVPSRLLLCISGCSNGSTGAAVVITSDHAITIEQTAPPATNPNDIGLGIVALIPSTTVPIAIVMTGTSGAGDVISFTTNLLEIN